MIISYAEPHFFPQKCCHVCSFSDQSYRKKDAFIATQSPLPNTVEDFWRLIYDWKCPLIVMLNQLDPMDKVCYLLNLIVFYSVM